MNSVASIPMKYGLPFLVAAAFCSGCVSSVKRPYAIQGHNPRNVVLYASKEIRANGMRLPPGYYYPMVEFNGSGLFVRNYLMGFFHPAGVMGRDLIGQWFRAPGGINVYYDPALKAPEAFIRHEGFGFAGGPVPDGAIQIIERPDALNSREAGFLQQQISVFNQQQMVSGARDAAVRGAVMAVPPVR